MRQPIKLEKRFIYAVVIGSMLFCTLYWYMSSSCKNRATSIYVIDRPHDYWRWECNLTENVCQRFTWKYEEAGMSLKTCQMACGPTPLWPQPNGEVILSNKSVSFNYKDIIILPINAYDITVRSLLSDVYKMFLQEIKPEEMFDVDTDVLCIYISTDIVGKSSDIEYKLGLDESYKLLITIKSHVVHIRITSSTFFGARHALETLRQLIWYEESVGHLRILSHAKIVDSPSFPYRGLLLDTTNHYLPVSVIKRTIHGMAKVKLNIFHWHMTGSSSFPFSFQNKQHAIYGAFSSKKIYTTFDVDNVIKYAQLRGVKVLVEIDNPGGIGQGWSWGHRKGVGDLNLRPNKSSSSRIDECTQLNPDNKASYKYLQDVLQQFRNLTKNPDITHLGGSVDSQCWADLPEIRSMGSYKQNGVQGVLKHHQNIMYKIISDIYKPKTPNIILWCDFFKQYNEPNKMIDSRIYIAQVNSESIFEDEKTLTNKGYRIIISHSDKWDLSYSALWITVYDHRPWNQLMWPQKKQILGGEALVWTKLIDQHNIDAKIWPNAAAIAEILWTDPEIENLSTVAVRLQMLRDHLVQSGISAASIAPKWCVQNPTACL